MFGAGPQETWTKAEAEEFEEHAAARLKATMISAAQAGGLLFTTLCCIVPFLLVINFMLIGKA